MGVSQGILIMRLIFPTKTLIFTILFTLATGVKFFEASRKVYVAKSLQRVFKYKLCRISDLEISLSIHPYTLLDPNIYKTSTVTKNTGWPLIASWTTLALSQSTARP